MAAWSGFLAASGFRYRGQNRCIEVAPRVAAENFRSFWATATGWGTFDYSGSEFSIVATEGLLLAKEVRLAATKNKRVAKVEVNGQPRPHRSEVKDGAPVAVLEDELKLEPGQRLLIVLARPK
jgi:hypothetical protein